MIFLAATVILNILVLIIFRYLSQFSVNTFQTIVINYFVCVFTGILFTGNLNLFFIIWNKSWFWIAVVLGFIFVTSFFLIATVTQKHGISIASLASKVSLAIPVAFSLWVFEIQMKKFTFLNYTGLILTLVAVVLSSLKKSEKIKIDGNTFLFFLPLLVFVISGLIDTSLNYVNLYYLSDQDVNAFTITLFLSAALFGVVIYLFQRKKPDPKSLPWGIALGGINFFTVIFLLKTLSYFGNDGAFTFPVVNTNIIIFSTLISGILFKESWSRYQVWGLVLGIVALILISYQEIESVLYPK